MNAFSTLGISSKTRQQKTPGILTLERPIMTFAYAYLSNLQKNDENLGVHTANDGSMPISAIGDVSHSLVVSHVFFAPKLTTNLLSVGQLLKIYCFVSFSRFECVVQDQVTREVIARRPKCGRLFTLQISPHTANDSMQALFYNSSFQNNCQLWHNNLGHMHSTNLMSLINSGSINDNKVSLKL